MKSGSGSRVRMNETTEEEALSSCATGQRTSTTIPTWRIPEGKFTLIKTVPVMSGAFSCVARARNSFGLH